MEPFQYMSNVGVFPSLEERNKGKSFELEMAHKTQSPIGGSQAVVPHFFIHASVNTLMLVYVSVDLFLLSHSCHVYLPAFLLSDRTFPGTVVPTLQLLYLIHISAKLV